MPRGPRSPGVLVMVICILAGVVLGQTIWRRLDGARDAAAQTAISAEPRQIASRGPLSPDEQSTIELFKKTSPSVVFVTTLQRVRSRFSTDVTEVPAGTGSGFLWDDAGHVVTNFHVTGPPSSNAYAVTLNNQKTYPAELVGIAPNNDLAVLKIVTNDDTERFQPMPLGSSSDLQVGQWVMAIGNPFGLDQSLTTGIVSALGRTITSPSNIPIEDVIQTDAAINPGNSGGPLLDSAGRVIGVNAQIRSPSGSNAGIGFAIPIDTVNRIVPSILKNYRPGRPSQPTQPSLGITLAPDNINARISQMSGLRGLLVMTVTPDGPADQAGVVGVRRGEDGPELNDVILSIGGHRVTNRGELVAALGHFDPDQEVEVKLWRDGKERTVTVKLGTAE